MSYERQGLEYGFLRCSDMVRDAERRAMRHPTFEPRSRAGADFYRKMTNWLGKQVANWGRGLHQVGTAPAHSEQPAG